MGEDYGSSGDETYDSDEFDFIDCVEGLEQLQIVAKRASSSKVITRASLLVAQEADLRKVMDLLCLKEHHARTLLIRFRWNVDKLITVFVEKGKDQLYEEVGLVVGDSDGQSSLDPLNNVICDICMEDDPSIEMTTMDCGHCFCNSCWTEYFIVKINEGRSKQITCMTHECCTICDEVKVRKLLNTSNPDLAERFNRFLLESYIDDNDSVKWCPSVPHCGNAIVIEDDKYCEVQCACGQQFCFNCLSETHSPCPCFMWESWVAKCRDESDSTNWLDVNTKHCPSCQKSVQKVGGCNHVLCLCGNSFCWNCGGPTGLGHTWTSIYGHTCGQYTEPEIQIKAVEISNTELNRYMHYYNNYIVHKNSLKAESKLKEKLKGKVKKLEQRECWAKDDYSWVFIGLDRLFRSRRVLCYSYPLAYYMFDEYELVKDHATPAEKKIKQNLFEDMQQQLEDKVEKLSMGLAQPFDDPKLANKFDETRLGVIDVSNVIDELCRNFYKFVENDLLGILPQYHAIPSYTSEGVEKASELSN